MKWENDYLVLSHLKETDEVCDFVCKKGRGLEHYLKYSAMTEELSGNARTYIVRDKLSGDIAAYFTLKTGLVTVRRKLSSRFDNYTGLELANLAVNDFYREKDDAIPKLGSYLFYEFIIPIVREVHEYVGAEYLYIFALPYNKLMTHYETMGFSRLSDKKQERFVCKHVKPNYDKGCIFMFQKI